MHTLVCARACVYACIYVHVSHMCLTNNARVHVQTIHWKIYSIKIEVCILWRTIKRVLRKYTYMYMYIYVHICNLIWNVYKKYQSWKFLNNKTDKRYPRSTCTTSCRETRIYIYFFFSSFFFFRVEYRLQKCRVFIIKSEDTC